MTSRAGYLPFIVSRAHVLTSSSHPLYTIRFLITLLTYSGDAHSRHAHCRDQGWTCAVRRYDPPLNYSCSVFRITFRLALNALHNSIHIPYRNCIITQSLFYPTFYPGVWLLSGNSFFCRGNSFVHGRLSTGWTRLRTWVRCMMSNYSPIGF